jgi:ribosomal protein S7
LNNPKKAIFDNVEDLHKVELRHLLEDINNAPTPSWVVTYNVINLLGSVDLSTLSYHDGRLVVLSAPGVYDLLNGSKKHKNKKVLREAFDRVIYTLKYENSGGLVDIFSFATKMQIALDIEAEWFKDLWSGGCATFELLRSRLSQYNSGKSDSDSHFFVYVRKVVSYRAVEQMLQSCLGGFRENACKELFIINYEWLTKCVDAVIDHNSEFLEFVNTYRSQIVEDTMNKAPVAATPVRLEKIKVSYQRVGEEEIELTIFNRETIDAIRSALEEFSPDNDTVKRSVFEGFLKERHPEVDIAKRKRPLFIYKYKLL